MDKLKMLYGELQARGLKLTKQRSAIIKMLNKSRVPLTAEEIFLRIRETNDNTSLATVYRNLKTLVTAGQCQDRAIGGKGAVSVGKPHSHDLICLMSQSF